jgi:hypothetical protein
MRHIYSIQATTTPSQGWPASVWQASSAAGICLAQSISCTATCNSSQLAYTAGKKLALLVVSPLDPLLQPGPAASAALGVLVAPTSWPASCGLPAATSDSSQVKAGVNYQAARVTAIAAGNCCSAASSTGSHAPWLRQPPGASVGPTSSAGSAAAGGPYASSYQVGGTAEVGLPACCCLATACWDGEWLLLRLAGAWCAAWRWCGSRGLRGGAGALALSEASTDTGIWPAEQQEAAGCIA